MATITTRVHRSAWLLLALAGVAALLLDWRARALTGRRLSVSMPTADLLLKILIVLPLGVWA